MRLLILLAILSPSLALPSLDPPTLLTSLKSSPLSTVTILLSMTPTDVPLSTESHLKTLQETSFPSRAERLYAVTNFLKNRATTSQQSLSTFLNLEKSRRIQSGSTLNFKQVWITNQVVIRNADLSLLQRLMGREDLSKIEQEKFFPLIDPIIIEEEEGMEERADELVQWGVAKIGAPSVYNMTKGEGIVVASIDTGALWSHEALVQNYRMEYGWYDGSSNPEVTRYPYDDNGHGTHTIGTMVGTMNGIGVAPGAKWIACNVNEGEEGLSQSGLLLCGQWVLCPTNVLGEQEDCSKAPHIVSNSWGAAGGQTFYNQVIDAWRAAGIIPIFAIGNDGAGCETAGSPGDYEGVIGVGSTTIDDQVSPFSSRGPVKNGGNLVKPDIVAPGSSIVSAYYLNETGYVTYSGTSMATPHVSGLIALMLSMHPDWGYDQVKEALIKSAIQTIPTVTECGGVRDSIYPNYMVGHGRVDAFSAVFPKSSGPTFFLSSFLVFVGMFLWNLY